MRKTTLILALLLTLPCVAQSVTDRNQLTFPLSLSVGDFGEYGYETPYSDISAGIEWRSRRLMVETNATYSPTAKNTVGDGYSLSGRAALFIRPARSLFVGGGISATQIRNSQWSKTATRSFLTAGLDTDQWRIALTRNTPGSDPNALTGWSASARVNLSPRIRIGGELFSSSFKDQVGQGRQAQGFVMHVDYVLSLSR